MRLEGDDARQQSFLLCYTLYVSDQCLMTEMYTIEGSHSYDQASLWEPGAMNRGGRENSIAVQPYRIHACGFCLVRSCHTWNCISPCPVSLSVATVPMRCPVE